MPRPTAGVLLLLFLALLGFASHAHALQRVVFVDRTFLDVEDAWADDKYVHFVYQGRPITVLRSDVARIEGTRPRRESPPPVAPGCSPPRVGVDDQAVRGYFRCLGVAWVRSPVGENGHQRWAYEGRIEGRLERYIVKDGRVVEVVAPAKP
jgi:hypothetical protein